MAIWNDDGLLKVRVRGVDSAVRELARINQEEKDAVMRGIRKAAEYLMEKIKDKFGKYQATGGDYGGAWAKLKFETRMKKLKKYGFADKPLIASGRMQNSFSILMSPTGRLAASVVSDDPKLIHHVYGAPRAHVPRRDPMLITAVEEARNCHKIIANETYTAYSGE